MRSLKGKNAKRTEEMATKGKEKLFMFALCSFFQVLAYAFTLRRHIFTKQRKLSSSSRVVAHSLVYLGNYVWAERKTSLFHLFSIVHLHHNFAKDILLYPLRPAYADCTCILTSSLLKIH